MYRKKRINITVNVKILLLFRRAEAVLKMKALRLHFLFGVYIDKR